MSDHTPYALMNCVPLSSARPSLERSVIGSQPCAASTSAAGLTSEPTSTSPKPTSGRQRCASGARSPEAPSEP